MLHFLQIIQTIIEQTLYHFTYLPTLMKNLIENVHFCITNEIESGIVSYHPEMEHGV